MADSTASAGTINNATASVNTEANVDAQTQSDGKPGFQPITSQEELDRIISGRVQRERAKYEGYAEFKAKAEKLPQVEGELAEVKEKLAGYVRAQELDGWKTKVSDETGVPASVLRGETLEELQAHAKELAQVFPRGKQMPVVPGAGSEPKPGGMGDMEQLARSLFQ